MMNFRTKQHTCEFTKLIGKLSHSIMKVMVESIAQSESCSVIPSALEGHINCTVDYWSVLTWQLYNVEGSTFPLIGACKKNVSK